MKLLPFLGALVMAVGLAFPVMPTASAETRSPPEATAHAFEELANACAQRRPECPTSTSTLTPTATWTSSPTATTTPVPPTDTPTPIPTPAPCWVTDEELGDPYNGWIVFDDQGAPVPCPTNTPMEEPIEQFIDTPSPTPTAALRQTPQPAPAAAVSAPASQILVVVQTVVVTAVPSETPVPEPRSVQVAGVVATAASSPSPTPTATPTPTPTATRTSVAALATPQPTAAPVHTAAFSHFSLPSFDRPWLYLSLLALLAAGGLVAFWLVRCGRRPYMP